jgi:CheY-like chemotaxis protein
VRRARVTTTKKHILCVDDNSDTCELVSLILKDYEVTSAYSMADAIKRATAERFDLYVLDYHLPDGTGLELCLMLRSCLKIDCQPDQLGMFELCLTKTTLVI